MSSQSSHGFTLIELMVTISIVAILAAIGMVVFSSAQGTARDAKRKEDLEDIKKALYLIKTSRGSLCGSSTFNCSVNAWNSPASDATYGMNTSTATANSMKALFITAGLLKTAVDDPKCPAGTCSSWNDYYMTIFPDDSFTLYARLETAPPASALIGCTANNGTGGANYNYCISQ